MKIRYKGEKTDYPVEFLGKTDHVVTLSGDFPVKTLGFDLVRDKYSDAWDYSNFKTIYRMTEDSVSFSDDGSIWVEPTKVNTIRVVWDDEGDTEGLRPESVEVDVFVNGEKLETINISDSKDYEDVESAVYTAEFEEVSEYEKTVNGLVCTYTHHVHHIPEPTVEDRLADLEEAVCELSDIVGSL